MPPNNPTFIDRTNKLSQTSKASQDVSRQSNISSIYTHQEVLTELNKLNDNIKLTNDRTGKFEAEQKRYRKLYSGKAMTFGPMMGMFAEMGLDKQVTSAYDKAKEFFIGSKKGSLTGTIDKFGKQLDGVLTGDKNSFIGQLKESTTIVNKRLSDTFIGKDGFVNTLETTLSSANKRIESAYFRSAENFESMFTSVNKKLTDKDTGFESIFEQGKKVISAGFGKIASAYEMLPLGAMAHSLYLPFKTTSTSKKILEQQRLREINANKALRLASGVMGVGSAVGMVSGTARVAKSASGFATGGKGWSGYVGGKMAPVPGASAPWTPGTPGLPGGAGVGEAPGGLPGLPGGAGIQYGETPMAHTGFKLTSSLRSHAMRKATGSLTDIDPTSFMGSMASFAPLIAAGIGVSVLKGQAFKRFARKHGRESSISPSAQKYATITTQYGKQWERDIRMSQDPKEAAMNKLGYTISSLIAPTLANFEILDVLRDQSGGGAKGGKAAMATLAKRETALGPFSKLFEAGESGTMKLMSVLNPFGSLLGQGYGNVRDRLEQEKLLTSGSKPARKSLGVSEQGFALIKAPSSRIMSFGQSHEEIMQLLTARILDIQRLSTSELVTIRSKGFGIKQAGIEVGKEDSFKDWILKLTRNTPILGNIIGLAELGLGAGSAAISGVKSIGRGMKAVSKFMYGRGGQEEVTESPENTKLLEDQRVAFDFFANSLPDGLAEFRKTLIEEGPPKEPQSQVLGFRKKYKANGKVITLQPLNQSVAADQEEETQQKAVNETFTNVNKYIKLKITNRKKETLDKNIKEFKLIKKSEETTDFRKKMLGFFKERKKETISKFKGIKKGGFGGFGGFGGGFFNTIKDFFFGGSAIGTFKRLIGGGGLLWLLKQRFLGDDDQKLSDKSFMETSYGFLEHLLGKDGAFATSLGVGAGALVFGQSMLGTAATKAGPFLIPALKAGGAWAMTPIGALTIGSLAAAAWAGWEINKQIKESGWYKKDAGYIENLKRGLSSAISGQDVEEYDIQTEIDRVQGRMSEDPRKNRAHAARQRLAYSHKSQISSKEMIKINRDIDLWKTRKSVYQDRLNKLKKQQAFEKIKVKQHDMDFITSSPQFVSGQWDAIIPKAKLALSNINQELNIIKSDPAEVERVGQLNVWRNQIQNLYSNLKGYGTILDKSDENVVITPREINPTQLKRYNAINSNMINDDFGSRIEVQPELTMPLIETTPNIEQQPINQSGPIPIPISLTPEVDPIIKSLIGDMFNNTAPQLSYYIKNYATF